jgi:hypothetical protein
MKMARLLPAVLLFFAKSLHAQSWDINIASGLSYARLIPMNHSTAHTDHIRYGFMKPGIYLSPELSLNIASHSRVSFSYQFSENNTGLRFRADKSSGYSESFESFDLHGFFVGFYHSIEIANGHALLGWYARLGLAYGYNTGGGSGGGSGYFSGNGAYVDLVKDTSSTLMPDFWMPDVTLGCTIGTNSHKPKLADRLFFSLSVTAGFKNIYDDYGKVRYAILTPQSYDQGVAQYQGAPLLLQAGLSYRLFRFRSGDR